MLKNVSKLEIQLEGRSYQLFCDSDSPLNHVKEALFQFLKYVGQVEDAVKATVPDPVNQEVKPEITGDQNAQA